jgi:Lon protease-like protein
MICPFDPCEKQVLLEAPTIAERSRLLMSFLQISGRDRSDSSNSRVQ